jgi:hypothetical protein
VPTQVCVCSTDGLTTQGIWTGYRSLIYDDKRYSVLVRVSTIESKHLVRGSPVMLAILMSYLEVNGYVTYSSQGSDRLRTRHQQIRTIVTTTSRHFRLDSEAGFLIFLFLETRLAVVNGMELYSMS